jgi:hypothetical protein
MAGVILKFLRLARLANNQPIVDPTSGYPTNSFLRYCNDNATNQVTITNAIVDQTNRITSALDQAGIATQVAQDASTAVDTANGNASTALATAGSVARLQALVSSFVDPNILTASLDGSGTATIAIAAHNRYYANGATVHVNAGQIVGQPLGVDLYISYLDTARTGGIVNFEVTPNMVAAAQIGDRHTIGWITTPNVGDGTTMGLTAPPPGIVLIH